MFLLKIHSKKKVRGTWTKPLKKIFMRSVFSYANSPHLWLTGIAPASSTAIGVGWARDGRRLWLHGQQHRQIRLPGPSGQRRSIHPAPICLACQKGYEDVPSLNFVPSQGEFTVNLVGKERQSKNQWQETGAKQIQMRNKGKTSKPTATQRMQLAMPRENILQPITALQGK